MNALSASWRTTTVILLSFVMQIGVPWHASAQTTSSEQRSFLLGTGSTGGTYHPMGVALSTLVKLRLLPSFNVDLTAINTKGSQENIELMQEGEIQFAILSGLSGYEGHQGVGRFSESGSNKDLRAITSLWFSADHVIVHKDSVQSGTIQDFTGLRGQAVSLGRASSGTLAGNRALMAPLGLDIDTDFNLVELGYKESAEALIKGEIAGMSVTGGVPVRAVQQVFEELGDEAAVLEFDDEQLATIDQGRRLWGRVVIPAGTYPGQDRDIFTLGTPNILAVHADVDDEVVYEITKTIFEELDYLKSLHQATKQISLDTAASNLPLPVHPGALRYFEEEGVELPSPPVELNPDLLARFNTTAEAKDALNRGTLVSMFSGASGDTSARAVADLAAILNPEEDNLRLLPTYGGGSGQNLTDLLYLQNVDSALVRTDIVAYAVAQGVYPFVDQQIAYITELFPEEVHLVVREEIGDIQELVGKKVNIGARGSGGDITASVILSGLDIGAQPTVYEPYMALDKLRSGEISGAIFVGGKPMPLLLEIESGSGLKLLPVPFVQYADSYRPAAIARRDYPNLVAGVSGDDVPTLAVRTALFTYDWRPGTARYQALADLSDVLFRHLRELQQTGHHPKWRDVDPTSQISGLKRFDPARRWLEENAGQAERIALQGRFLIEQSLSIAPSGEGNRDPLASPSSVDAALSPRVLPGSKPEQGSLAGQDSENISDASGGQPRSSADIVPSPAAPAASPTF